MMRTNYGQHRKAQANMRRINRTIHSKNADYGDSFHKSFEKYGLVMSAIRLGDKFNRFEQLSLGAENYAKTESIRDTLLDFANYAIMTVAEIDGIKEEDN